MTRENTNESKGYLFLPRSSVKQVKNFRIKHNLVPCYHLLFTKLHQWNQSCISKTHKQSHIKNIRIIIQKLNFTNFE